MDKSKKRKIWVSLAGIGLVAAALALIGLFNSSGGGQKAPPGASSSGKASSDSVARTAVRATTVSPSEITRQIPLTGRVVPEDRVDVYAEYAGRTIKGAKPFKAGTQFNAGQVMLRQDASELRQSIKSAKSQFVQLLSQTVPDLRIDYPAIYEEWKNYLLSFDVTQPLRELPAVQNDQQRLFLTGRNIYSQFYTVQELESRLSKYVIRAPFSGTLTQATIDPGTIASPGQKLGEISRTGTYELEASVDFDNVEFLSPGQVITFHRTNSDLTFQGRLIRINETVDPETQLVSVFFRLESPRLRTGVYLQGTYAGRTYQQAVRLPRQAIVDDAYVFVVQDSTARLRQVDVKGRSLDQVLVTGLDSGQRVILTEQTKAFEGTPVSIVQD
ncbi:efflux RND transporter periplasmic adaptor subunit [Roseivirga sp. BDSF3-8]|uniref:efflux RND transporter periplasmic adaptor subunit n=1 Tax=Roseivirga sp. BDSF3-8 TaxID=3241598 RepID=UPI003532017B